MAMKKEKAADTPLETQPSGQETETPAVPPQAAAPKPIAGRAASPGPIPVKDLIKPGDPTVTMTIPQQRHKGPILLRRQDQTVVAVPTGITEVPVALSEHWHLKACGGKPYTR